MTRISATQREVGAVGSSDYMIPGYDFTREFKTTVPDNAVWKGDVTYLLQNSIQIYTDGSKLNGAVGSGIFSESKGICQYIRLPDHCSVFQAVVVAIQAAAGIVGDGKVSKRNVIILSDSQAAIKALSSIVMNSKTVYGCRRFLNGIAKRYDIHIVWVPGRVIFQVTAELMNLPGRAQPSNSPMSFRIWASL